MSNVPMSATVRKPEAITPLKNIAVGQVFIYNDEPYVRSEHNGVHSQEDCIVCFCFNGGEFDLIDPDEFVKPAILTKYEVEVA